MTAPLCRACGKPVADQAHLCGTCGAKLRRALLALGVPELDRNHEPMPTLVDELETVVRREARFAGRVGSRSTETSLPYNPTGSELARDLRNLLTTWVRLVCDERGLQPPTLDGEPPRASRQGDPTTLAAHRAYVPAQRCELTELPAAYCAHCAERIAS